MGIVFSPSAMPDEPWGFHINAQIKDFLEFVRLLVLLLRCLEFGIFSHIPIVCICVLDMHLYLFYYVDSSGVTDIVW